MPEFSFKKGERLSSNKSISSLFQSGRSVIAYPLKIIYYPTNEGKFPASLAIAVPKRLFKRAVDRNLLKRRIREAYRLNKPEFYKQLSERNVKLKLVIQFTHGEIVDFKTIQEGLSKGVTKLLHQINKESKKTLSE